MRSGTQFFQFARRTRLLFVGMAPFPFGAFCSEASSRDFSDVWANHHYSFVTGLVDSKIHGQRKTMFQRAVDLGLPASFVELRHEATHREPPSLVVLRKATQRSLEWLWDNYWAEVDGSGDAVPIEQDEESAKSACRDVLQRFSDGTVPGSTGPPSKKRKRDQEDSVAARLISICNASSQGVRALSIVLTEGNHLVDSGRK